MLNPTSANSAYGPRGWRAVYVPVGIIFVGLGVLIILPALLLPRFGIGLDLHGRTLVGLGGTLTTELILFGFLWRWLKAQGRTLRHLGWGRPTTWPANLVGIIFAVKSFPPWQARSETEHD